MELITEIVKTIALGIIQGISEWLPISSTGHMILFNSAFPLNFSQEFINLFLVVIQLGSILAVVVLYYHKLNPFSKKKNNMQKKNTINLWLKVIVAALPGAIIGLLFNDLIEDKLSTFWVVAITLIVYGILFIIIEKMNNKPNITRLDDLPYKTAFFIGAFQVLALIPGTSRSGSTILGGMVVGTSRVVASEFSFFLAIPMMFGASALKLVKFIIEGGAASFGLSELFILLLGSFVAFLVSIIAIRFLMSYIKKHDFKIFGYYRIVLGIIVLIAGFIGFL